MLSMLLLATVSCQPQAQPPKEVALPSGKKIKVLGVGQLNFSNDSPALILKYQTNLKISDVVALRKEVEEIWASFKRDVEAANLVNAIISANEVPRGVIVQQGNAYNFVYRKAAGGKWQLVGNSEKGSGGPQKKQ